MKNFKENIELIEQYLDGELDVAGKRNVEQMILDDKEFEQIFSNTRSLIDGIKYSARRDLKSKVGEWEDELSLDIDSQVSSRKIWSMKWYYIAASIAIILVSNILIFNNLNSGFSSIIEDYYTPYNYIPTTTRGGENATNSFELIFENYDQGQYDKVIEMVYKTDASVRTNEINYLLANSYQASGDFDAAIKIYKELLNTDTQYKRGSQWYLALCYLSKENKDLAIPILKELSASNTSKSVMAQEILEKLN